MEKGFNNSDNDSDIAEHPTKKACREIIQYLTMKTKYSKNWENIQLARYDEDINGAYCRVCK